MTNAKFRKTVVTDQEIESEFKKAERIKEPYFRLRAKATVAFLETGKRRGEICQLEISDITQDNRFLYVTFNLEKKKRHSKKCPTCNTKNPAKATYCQKCGINIQVASIQINSKIDRVTKKFELTSLQAQMIIEYIEFLKEHVKGNFVYPSGKSLFGELFIFDGSKHLKSQAIWRIIKALNEKDWPHLHRERRAVKVIRADEAKFGQANLETVYRIKNRLDLEREQTAYNYIRRHETQRVEEEIENE